MALNYLHRVWSAGWCEGQGFQELSRIKDSGSKKYGWFHRYHCGHEVFKVLKGCPEEQFMQNFVPILIKGGVLAIEDLVKLGFVEECQKEKLHRGLYFVAQSPHWTEAADNLVQNQELMCKELQRFLKEYFAYFRRTIKLPDALWRLLLCQPSVFLLIGKRKWKPMLKLASDPLLLQNEEYKKLLHLVEEFIDELEIALERCIPLLVQGIMSLLPGFLFLRELGSQESMQLVASYIVHDLLDLVSPPSNSWVGKDFLTYQRNLEGLLGSHLELALKNI